MYFGKSSVVICTKFNVSVEGFSTITPTYLYGRGHTVEQLVHTLYYKPEGRGFDSR